MGEKPTVSEVGKDIPLYSGAARVDLSWMKIQRAVFIVENRGLLLEVIPEPNSKRSVTILDTRKATIEAAATAQNTQNPNLEDAINQMAFLDLYQIPDTKSYVIHLRDVTQGPHYVRFFLSSERKGNIIWAKLGLSLGSLGGRREKRRRLAVSHNV